MRPLPLWLSYRVAAVVAEICYYFFPRHRKNLNANLAQVMASSDRKAVDRVARRAFRNFGKFVIDFVHFPYITREEVHRRLVFKQWDELDEAMAAGRGVLIVTIHFGIWDLGAAALAAYDYPTNAIADSFGYDKMTALIHGSREKLGMKIIPMERVGPGVFRALKRGEILAMLIDVPPPGQTVEVEFFGAPATVSTAPARVALRTGAWVVPSIVFRGPQHDQLIRPILDTRGASYTPTGDEEADVRNLTQLIMSSLERHIKQQPDQWFIFRRLWPTTPEPWAATETAEAELAPES
jgi:KDO2-lipid IV(A) lauroyltransferase